MPRIPIYGAQQSLDPDPGGLPTVRTSHATANALKQIGQSIGGLARPAKDADLLRRSREQQDKRQRFDRIRKTHDTVAGMEAELVRRRDEIVGDGVGFYQTFVDEVLVPTVDAEVHARPKEDQDRFRERLLQQAEPLLEAAALIERDRSLRFYLAETDRIADRIVGELSLESYEKAEEDLSTLLEAAPIPASTKRAKGAELDRKLARQLYDLMLAKNPASLTDGLLGWPRRKGKSRRVDPRFEPLPASERQDMFERAIADARETGLLNRGTPR